MDIKFVPAKHFLTPTKLGRDFACNPYVGCEHGCLYCYAKSFADFKTTRGIWGSFLDIREYPTYDIPKGTGHKTVLFSSATDCYQPKEAEYHRTRTILENIVESDLSVSILTKSSLILRDMDLFLRMKNVEIGFSISLNDVDARRFEPQASLPSERISALKTLKKAGIRTYVFVAPIIPHLTDLESIVKAVDGQADYWMFDGLNLKDPQNQSNVFRVIDAVYPQYSESFRDIFVTKTDRYYEDLRREIDRLIQRYSLVVQYRY